MLMKEIITSRGMETYDTISSSGMQSRNLQYIKLMREVNNSRRMEATDLILGNHFMETAVDMASRVDTTTASTTVRVRGDSHKATVHMSTVTNTTSQPEASQTAAAVASRVASRVASKMHKCLIWSNNIY